MLRLVDNFLNKITMYRLVLYYLIVLVLAALALGYFGMLPFGPLDLALSTAVLLAVCWIANNTFAKVFNVPANVESVYITALILALIITPLAPAAYISGLPFFVWAGVWAMAAKYILAIRKKHIFNPAAFAVALTALTLNQAASWWIGTPSMLAFVLIGGLLVVRKTIRFDLVFSFAVVGIITMAVSGLARGTDLFTTISRILLATPFLFFAFIMLTEPLTMPPTRWLRILYGALVGFLFAPSLHLGSVYSTPELALLIGNIFSYIVSPKERYVLKLREKVQLSPDVFDFVFAADRGIAFRPGQYLEWTLGHRHSDSRGNRRYFTIASSPGENEVRIGVKFYPKPSSFKRSLYGLRPGQEIIASQRAGDFVLPGNKKKKLVFMAGGIGVTPFRSMVRDLLDKNERRTITVFYLNKTASDIVYEDVFEEARERLGMQTIYALTETASIPESWAGERGLVDIQMIARAVPDYRERIFYLSGPRSFVIFFEDLLKSMGLPRRQMKTDFFPGFV